MLKLGEFKKVKDEKDHAILRHAKGHEIKILKKALSGKLRAQLDKLPHFAEGTVDGPVARQDVSDSDPNLALKESYNMPLTADSNPENAPPNAIRALHYAMRNGAEAGATPSLAPDLSQGQPQTQLAGPGGIPLANASGYDDYGYKQELASTQRGLSGMQQALKRQGNLSAEQGEKVSGLEHQASDQAAQALEHFQQSSMDIDNERQAFMQDIANTHIDPNKYLGDMSTTGKVSTAIGLLLGGIGGGLTHQENPALKFMNAQIDRDIAAQQANLGTKKSLLAANMERFKNLAQATDMTRVMMNDMTSAEIKSQMAKYGGQVDQQKANFALNQLGMDSAQRLQQLKMQNFLMSGAGAGNEIPDAIDPNLGSSFRLNGVKHYAADPEAAKKARDESAALEGLAQSAADINAFNKAHGTVGGPGVNIGLPTQLKGQADALNSVAAAKLAQIEAQGGNGIGRLIGHFKNGMPQAGATFQQEQKGKSRGIDSLLREGHNTIVNTYGTRGPNLFLPPKGKK